MPAELAEEIVARCVAGEPAGYIAGAVSVSDERVYGLLRARYVAGGGQSGPAPAREATGGAPSLVALVS